MINKQEGSEICLKSNLPVWFRSSSSAGNQGQPAKGSVPRRSWPALAPAGLRDEIPAGSLPTAGGSSSSILHGARLPSPPTAPPVQGAPPSRPPPQLLLLSPPPPSPLPAPLLQGVSQASQGLSFLRRGEGARADKRDAENLGKPQCEGASNPGSSPASGTRTPRRTRGRHEPPAEPRRPRPPPFGLAVRAAPAAAAADAAGAPRQR